MNYSLFDTKWIPCSAKFVVMGSRPRGSGIIQIYEVSSGELKLVKDIERSQPVKCGTFKASSLKGRHLATGDFQVSIIIKEEYLYALAEVDNKFCSVSITTRHKF